MNEHYYGSVNDGMIQFVHIIFSIYIISEGWAHWDQYPREGREGTERTQPGNQS